MLNTIQKNNNNKNPPPPQKEEDLNGITLASMLELSVKVKILVQVLKLCSASSQILVKGLVIYIYMYSAERRMLESDRIFLNSHRCLELILFRMRKTKAQYVLSIVNMSKDMHDTQGLEINIHKDMHDTQGLDINIQVTGSNLLGIFNVEALCMI